MLPGCKIKTGLLTHLYTKESSGRKQMLNPRAIKEKGHIATSYGWFWNLRIPNEGKKILESVQTEISLLTAIKNKNNKNKKMHAYLREINYKTL